MVTLAIFPGTFFLSHFRFMKTLDKKEFTYYSLIVILTFNVCDTIGRKAAGMYQCPAKMAYFLSFIRIGFLATTCLIAKDELSDNPFLESDAFKVVNLVLFALLNGYVGTVLAIIAPSFVE
jgi:hypothetical protein